MNKPFATIILAGGKGTRMGSSQKHKACFEVLGVPVIIRALETYTLCGATMNVIVVGMLAESVMSTVGRRFPGVGYAFQERQLGTGDAARKGAEILERLDFHGPILLVAGDKVIDPKVVRQLLETHAHSGADVTVASARRPAGSSAGILVKSERGRVLAILEEAERRRVMALGQIHRALRDRGELPRPAVELLAGQCCSEKTASRIVTEFWPDGSEQPLTLARFEALIPEPVRSGTVETGGLRFPAARILDACDQMNLSTYVFRADVLYDALARLKPSRPNQEEYLTDIFEVLASQQKPARIVASEIRDAHDLMGFNNPQELLAIEAVYRKKQGDGTVERRHENGEFRAPLERWANLLETPSAAARRQFQNWYGHEVPWAQFRVALEAFAERFGNQQAVSVFRSPGRLNLLGRHVDHQGGPVNVMAVNREIIVVAAPRADDTVRLANAEGSRFSEQTFRISDLVANLNWDDWQHVIDGPRLQRLLEGARGDWANYVKAAILRLQDQFRDRLLRGLDIMVSGAIPIGAGLSSSSALVVATAEAVRAFNQLPVSARRLVSLCGEGEWFVGTRGGAADHAAIKLSHRGCVTRVSFFPFRIEDSSRFLPEHEIVVCNSGIYAGKSHRARNTFNAKVTAYHIARAWFKRLNPDLAPRVEHLRDITAPNLGLRREVFAGLLTKIPVVLTRGQVQAAFPGLAEAERARLERLFQSHDAPPRGYRVRDAMVFGLSEMARARLCLELLRKSDARGLGRLMNLSHDGDRVSRRGKGQTWRRVATAVSDAQLDTWAASRRDIAVLSGSYGCSLPELDRIADLAMTSPGVEGAQLAGAGLGGCVMVLVQKEHASHLRNSLAQQGITAEIFRPIGGASNLTVV